MRIIIVSTMSLVVLLGGCGQEDKEEKKEEVKLESSKVIKTEKTNKDKINNKKSEKDKKKIKKQHEKLTSETPTTEMSTTEVNVRSTEQVQQNNLQYTNQAELKTNEFGEKIIGYTDNGTEIIGYTQDGTPIVDEMRKQPTPVVQPSEAEQAEFRKNLPNGLSSGEIQLRNLILDGLYTEPDAQERLAEINSLEARYGN
ncbi:hypothetical protein ACMGE7_05110 [Macrococcus equi]|uniref:hypothetical protein n=1 Tax=Macrococcus equi TaxID=3395462 RepID=UPI0039BDD2B7